jgi:hypothetical protein
MAFNSGVLLGGSNVVTLTYAGGDTTYNVESELFAAFGIASSPNVSVLLNITGDILMSDVNLLGIDANDMHSGALLIIDLQTVDINARGGNGGAGGAAISGVPSNGLPGQTGGSAIRLGCDTTIRGTGTIRAGFGGGGGGAGDFTVINIGGGGGGGGAPFGLGGAGGSADDVPGDSGNDATVDTAGAAKVTGSPDGGAGGDTIGNAEAGEDSSSRTGGIAGGVGFTVIQQGFTLSKEGSVVYEGSEQA